MKIFIVVTALLFSNTVFAATFFVQEAQGVNVSKDDANAVTELVKGSVSEVGNHSVTSDAKSANYNLRIKVLKLGNSFVMTIDKYAGDQKKYSSQLKAAIMDEMDKVSHRLVRAVIDETAVKSDARVDEVTDSEVASGKRKETLRRWYLGLGPSSTVNLNNNGTLFGFALGYAWDMKDAALKLMWETVGASMTTFSLAGNYYFSDRDKSPLVSASFGYGSAIRTSSAAFLGVDEPRAGFTLGAGFGYQFFRTSNVALEITAYGSMIMNANSLGNPMMYGLRAGFYF